jgi:hypothetical protein
LGLAMFEGSSPPCRALERERDGIYSCGLVKLAGDFDPGMASAMSSLLGLGMGCDSTFAG